MLTLNLSYTLASFIKFGMHLYGSEEHVQLQVALNLIWILIFYSSNLHNLNRDHRLADQVNKILTSLVINVSVVLTLWFVVNPAYSRQLIFLTFFFFSSSAVIWRIVWFYLIRFYRKRGYNVRHVAMVGYEGLAERMIRFIKSNPGLGYNLVGIFDEDPKSTPKHVGTVDEVERYIQENPLDILFCNLNVLSQQKLQHLVNVADSNLVKVKIISQFSKMELDNLTLQRYGIIPVLNVNAIPLDNSMNQFIKRAFDIVFSGITLLLICSWLFPVIALLIRLESSGPIFFRQRRHGKNNRTFDCLKFRTMILNTEADHKQATKNDSRITKIGRFLRKTSIDELPQFINVFLGDMSVVGPRPHPIKLNEEYQPSIEKFWQRHAVKPGITGLAQAKGYRGETDFNAMNSRVRLDRFYVKNWSLLLDLKIIFLTIFGFIKGSENAY
ncbi:MAG: undecaprenyl-phosphate glucose phosphotransferase [Cytophagales bacterium]|nr:undecaprenyl-phosphate glucose phosphotransferase [Cytophagales bacterium]